MDWLAGLIGWYQNHQHQLLQTRPELWNHWILVQYATESDADADAERQPQLPPLEQDQEQNFLVQDLGTEMGMEEAMERLGGYRPGYFVFFGDSSELARFESRMEEQQREPAPPLVSPSLAQLFAWYAENVDRLAREYDGKPQWIILEQTGVDGIVQARPTPTADEEEQEGLEEAWNVDDLTSLLEPTPSNACRLVVPVCMSRKQTCANVYLSGDKLKRHHEVAVNQRGIGMGTVRNMLVDTGCTVTCNFARQPGERFGNGHTYVLHLLSVPGGERLCLRVCGGVELGLNLFGWQLKSVDAVSYILDAELFYHLFRQVKRSLISEAPKPGNLLSTFHSNPSFWDWIACNEYQQPSHDLEKFLLGLGIHPLTTLQSKAARFEGLLGQNYLEQIDLHQVAGKGPLGKTTTLTMVDQPNATSTITM